MSPLNPGWFDTYLMILSAVMALGWMTRKTEFYVPVLFSRMRPLNTDDNRVHYTMSMVADTECKRDRRKLKQLPSSLSREFVL